MGTIRNLVSIRAKSAVHPHGRGDNTGKAPVFRTPIGSPPRAWGQSTLVVPDARAPRFTPTGVGTMQIRRIFLKIPSVHPHGRGDNSPNVAYPVLQFGSPPRAWGQSVRALVDMIELRFTPTGVGTIKAIASLASNSSVHPHGRGDNKMRIRQIGTLVGSPPRAWGQSDRGGAVGVGERFTPTGVGTIRNQRWCSTPETVHPHGRGDNLTLNCEKDFDIGSPPRAWGQLCSSSSRHNSSRFTPTGVGTIARCHAAQPVTAVHPHGRGDNGVDTRVSNGFAGSPPRVWGQ